MLSSWGKKASREGRREGTEDRRRVASSRPVVWKRVYEVAVAGHRSKTFIWSNDVRVGFQTRGACQEFEMVFWIFN